MAILFFANDENYSLKQNFIAVLFVSVLANSFFVCEAFADPPTSGLLYNTTEDHSLTHNCKLLNQATMECKFTQTIVRKKINEGEASKRLQTLLSDFERKSQIFNEKDCSEFSQMLRIFKGEIPAPNQAKIAELNPRKKTDMIEFLSLTQALCKSPSRENFRKWAQFSIDQEKRTCMISSSSFTQTFKRADNKTWTVVPEREGICGVVRLDRFELDMTSVAGKPYPFWNYIVRKAVTNPNAKFIGDMLCKDLDEREYRYEWRKRDLNISCDHVEFGVF